MDKHFFNLATAPTTENSDSGLMICGINWGGAEDSDYVWSRDILGDSFFSDRRFNDYPYRNRVVRWFERLGHPLASDVAAAGPFERSIVQTNWMRSQAPNMHGRDLHAECVREWGNFEFHVQRLRPRLIVFMSVQLLEVLNSPPCIGGARRLFGSEAPVDVQTRDLVRGEKRHKRFRVASQKFERAHCLALPHPTGTRGLSDDYVAAFADVIDPLLRQYKSQRGFAS